MKGTKFQIKVWKYLKRIPRGKIKTYKQVAKGINRPKSARAVANACGKNPYAPRIPCHRVIGKNGDTLVIKDLVDVFDNPNHAGFTRTISLALRHGAAINYVVEQLQKDREMDMFSFSKVIARVLKNYIKDGTRPGATTCENCGAEGTLVYQEGCVTCTACGSSKCS